MFPYRRLAVLSLLCLSSLAVAAPPKPGFHANVTVSAPTKLDWTFAVSRQSRVKLPDEWKMTDYSPTKQIYELFVPAPKKEPKNGSPLLIYIAPSDNPNGFKSFEKLVKAKDMYFVAPKGAGNSTPGPKRIRIILDVLNDVRSQYNIDPDRTYITGFSGGGRMACHIAFALPELFGGVMPICAGELTREEPWLRHRVVDRLSVAMLTGEKDFNRGEVERLRATYLTAVGVRNKVWTVNGLGHGIPGEKTQAEAITWLEVGLANREKLAKQWPASRFADGDRETQAKALFAEGKARLENKQTLFTGLMQIKGVSERWPDLDVGKQARTVLLKYDDLAEKPWEVDDVADQLRLLVAQARSLDKYATGELDKQYQKEKPKMLRSAIETYELITKAAPKSDAAKEASERLPVLKKLLGE